MRVERIAVTARKVRSVFELRSATAAGQNEYVSERSVLDFCYEIVTNSASAARKP